MGYTITEADLDRMEERLKAYMAQHPDFDPDAEVFDGPFEEQMAYLDYDILVRHGRIKA